MTSEIPGNLLTTAMAVMPHTDVERALEMALSLDVPFWPQLPNYSYYEDMYVQAGEHFPGIVLDIEARTLRFSMEKSPDVRVAALAQYPDEVDTLMAAGASFAVETATETGVGFAGHVQRHFEAEFAAIAAPQA